MAVLLYEGEFSSLKQSVIDRVVTMNFKFEAENLGGSNLQGVCNGAGQCNWLNCVALRPER
jgi:hypothetical protein